jgi:uncharacterized protein (TIGR02996 family)
MVASKAGTEGALLRGVLLHPDEDTHRLVYADWLEENGRAERAEFVRVQCALERCAGDDPQRFALAQRERELYPKVYGETRADLPKAQRDHTDLVFRRGFVDEVRATAINFEKCANGLSRRQPVRLAELNRIDAGRLAAFPGLARVSGLGLSNTRAAELEVLFASPHLVRLNELRVYWAHDCSAARFLKLLGAPAFAGLTELTVCGLEGNGWVERFVRSPLCAPLTGLNLSSHFTASDVPALASSPHLSRLKSLTLTNYTQAGAGILPALAASPQMSSVTNLTIDAGAIPEADVEALAASRYFGNLTDLSLGWAGLTPSGWEKLLRAPRLSRLTRVHVHGWEYDVPVSMGLQRMANTKGIAWVWVPR